MPDNHSVLVAKAMTALFAAALSAQTQARLGGRVVDPTGAGVPGASVILRNETTGTAATSITSEEGIYNFPFVNPGRYAVTVEKPGFKRYQRGNLTLETGLVRSLDLALEIGDVSDSVNVTAEVPLLQFESSSVNQLIEQKNIGGMPL